MLDVTQDKVIFRTKATFMAKVTIIPKPDEVVAMLPVHNPAPKII